MFFGLPARGDQKAMVTVIESPKYANVPLTPVKRAWTFRIGSIQDRESLVGSAAKVTRAQFNSLTSIGRHQQKTMRRSGQGFTVIMSERMVNFHHGSNRIPTKPLKYDSFQP